jgi:hypothetical protein
MLACLLVVYFGVFGVWEKVHCFCSLHSIITKCLKTISQIFTMNDSKKWQLSWSYYEPFFGAVDKQYRFLSLQYFVSSASLREEGDSPLTQFKY